MTFTYLIKSMTKTRATSFYLHCAMAVALLLSGNLVAQTSAGDLQAGDYLLGVCNSLAPNTPRADALRKVCLYAVTIPQRMPNFTCDQKTSRYLGKKATDEITAVVTYEDGNESYRDVKANGRPVNDPALTRGSWSTGQFGGDVRNLFDTSNKVSFQFVSESEVDGRRVLTFQYQVPLQKIPSWRLRVKDQVVAPPYHGQLWIDEDKGLLRRLEVEATEIPEDFPMSSADLQIDYSDIPFDDGTSFVLPVKSVVNDANRKGVVARNVMEFSNCHKFRATAHIVPH
ncbi:MAG: hypothetical protein ACLPPV_19490 [Candidatus Korobacteraceae bacterium]|jgi:hypothetical protein